jgi:hypothetical protein
MVIVVWAAGHGVISEGVMAATSSSNNEFSIRSDQERKALPLVW